MQGSSIRLPSHRVCVGALLTHIHCPVGSVVLHQLRQLYINSCGTHGFIKWEPTMCSSPLPPTSFLLYLPEPNQNEGISTDPLKRFPNKVGLLANRDHPRSPDRSVPQWAYQLVWPGPDRAMRVATVLGMKSPNIPSCTLNDPQNYPMTPTLVFLA